MIKIYLQPVNSNFYRLDVYHNTIHRAWSIAVHKNPRNPWIETMFLPDFIGPVDQRVETHNTLTDALRFIDSGDLDADVIESLLAANSQLPPKYDLVISKN